MTEQTYNIITTYLKEQIDKLITKTRYAYKEVLLYDINTMTKAEFLDLNQKKRDFRKALSEIEAIYKSGIDKSL